jgi:hypothetical protein
MHLPALKSSVEQDRSRYVMALLQSMSVAEGFTSDYLHISFDPLTGILYVKWTDDVSFSLLKKGYHLALRYSQTYRVHKWLIDVSELPGLPESYQKWVNNELLPKILRSTKRNCFVAGVLPVSYYNNVQDWFDSSELIDKNYLLLFNHFLLPQAGLRWLNSLS